MDHREMPDERKQCCAHYECQVHPDLHAQHAALQIWRKVIWQSALSPGRSERATSDGLGVTG
jgi:hypothetical protein